MLPSPRRTDAGPRDLSGTHRKVLVEGLPDVSDALDRWLAAIVLSGKSPNTRATYAAMTRPLRRLNVPVNQVREADCEALILERLRRSANSAALCHAALKAFFRWCCEERRWTSASPMDGIPPPKHYEPPVTPLSDDQMRALMDEARTDDEQLLLRLLATGMRVHELAALRWDDIDFARGIALLRVTKGRRPRLVYLDPAALALLDRTPRTDARVMPVNTQTIRNRLGRIARRCKLPRTHPHLLRHTWASAFYRKTKDPIALQQLGGWSNQRSMQRYIKTVMQDAAIEKAREIDLSSDFFGDA
jgi:integrase